MEKPETLIKKEPALPTPDKLSSGPTIRVKITVPALKNVELEAVSGKSVLSFNGNDVAISGTGITLKKTLGNKLQFNLDKKRYVGSVIGLQADVVRIKNWNNTPAWDTKKTYNDNVYRGKIEVRMEGKNFIVINELPLEDYLKGIAEVSNADNPEKIKTILVAARSYAYWYSQKENRKFPGKPYDASDNPNEFQKYVGYGYELRSPITKKLVEETNGILILYANAPVKPWYFNDANGRTLSAKEYCEMNGGKNCADIPYLQSVEDPGTV